MKLDRKFYGELRKVKDDSVVPDDQWNAFLTKDNAFAAIVQLYPAACRAIGCDDEQYNAALVLVRRINLWRDANPELCKVPDAKGEKLLP